MAQAASEISRPSRDYLDSLAEASEILASPLDLRPALERVFAGLARNAGVVRAAVVVVEADEIRVDVSLGFGPEAQRARCKPGQGVIGRVVETGDPAFAASVGREPLFSTAGVDRASDGTFLCLPLPSGVRPLGALAIELARDEAPLAEARRFFTVVATMISQAFQIRRPLHENGAPPREEGLGAIVGVSRPMCRACDQIARIAPTDAPVLLRGEAGTGKELIARVIHRNSRRAHGPFLSVNVGTAPEPDLFGHQQGSLAPAPGGLELAAGGTLFLDEVGDLAAVAQANLLGLLREGKLEAASGGETMHTDIRIVAATSKDLERMVATGAFRNGLFRRLQAATVVVPPLRERDTDILMLADHFVARYSREHGRHIRRIAQPAVDLLMSYQWPGNVRELENVIERAVLTCESGTVHACHLPPALQIAEMPKRTVARGSLSEAVRRYEKQLILDALNTVQGNRLRAARLLETTERIISYKIRKYGIDARRFRERG